MTAAMCRTDLQRFPDPGTDRVVLVDPVDGRQFRLTAQAVRVLDLLDGSRAGSDIATALGATQESAASIDDAIERLLAIGLAVDLSTAPTTKSESSTTRLMRSIRASWQRVQRPGRRIRYSPPATLEFTLLNPRRMLHRLARMTAPIGRPSAQFLLGAVSVVGLVVFFAQWPAHRELLARQTTLPVLIAAMALTLLTTAVHELAHGIVLHRHGGTVRRMGAMLMYGSPALFCDVSQAWRLPRRHRVTVALAGVRVHLFTAGLVALILFSVPMGSRAEQLLCFVVLADLSMALINLVPFVKFDGYIALVGHTDIPHLRQKSMDLVRGALARVVFGGRAHPVRDGGPSGAGWTMFGAACAITGPLLGGWALISYGPILAALAGRYGAVAVVLVAAFLVYLPVRGLLRAAKLAAERGASRVRRWCGAVIAAGVIGALLMAIPLPLSTSGPFARTAYGVFLEVSPDAVPAAGTQVRLTRSGILLAAPLGTATVCGPAAHHLLPAMAGSPLLDVSAADVDRLAVPLCPPGGGRPPAAATAGPATPLPTDGMAATQTTTAPAADWLRAVFFAPYLRVIFSN